MLVIIFANDRYFKLLQLLNIRFTLPAAVMVKGIVTLLNVVQFSNIEAAVAQTGVVVGRTTDIKFEQF